MPLMASSVSEAQVVRSGIRILTSEMLKRFMKVESWDKMRVLH